MTVQLYAEECEVYHYMELGIEYPATEFNLFDEYRLDLSKLSQLDPIQGMRFRAFDLNGNLIRSGKWREEYADEFRTPTIVRFENGLAVPLPRKKVH